MNALELYKFEKKHHTHPWFFERAFAAIFTRDPCTGVDRTLLQKLGVLRICEQVD